MGSSSFALILGPAKCLHRIDNNELYTSTERQVNENDGQRKLNINTSKIQNQHSLR
jgi:hypothetical protein